jgi:tartrate/fumarate subfamily iron-sulfur-dependent hydro-lyase beta chain
MALVKLTTPISDAQVRALTVGDTVEITGRLYTGRDAVHHRLHQGQKPPVDLAGHIIYHCGPVMVWEGPGGATAVRSGDNGSPAGGLPKAPPQGKWVCKGAGPTTSSREEPYQWEVIRDHRIRGVIGKGGMGAKTLAACREHGCVYLHAIGGAAQVCAETITRVDGVDWMDLGSPEAIWHLWVVSFPAIVTMDSKGNSLHQQVFDASAKALGELKA